MISSCGLGSLENRTGQRRRSLAASHNEIIAENRCASFTKFRWSCEISVNLKERYQNGHQNI